MKAEKHWNRLTMKVTESPSSGILKTGKRLEKVLSSCTKQGVELYHLQGPFSPNIQ